MKWIDEEDQEPTKNGRYFMKAKGGRYKFIAYYYVGDGWLFPNDIVTNASAQREVQWLDEEGEE